MHNPTKLSLLPVMRIQHAPRNRVETGADFQVKARSLWKQVVLAGISVR